MNAKPHIFSRDELLAMSGQPADLKTYEEAAERALDAFLCALGASGDSLAPLASLHAKSRRSALLRAANRLIRLAE